jgi:hypothetical protein
LAGLGGEALWKRLNSIEDMLEKKFPLFDWFNLIVASPTKRNTTARGGDSDE